MCECQCSILSMSEQLQQTCRGNLRFRVICWTAFVLARCKWSHTQANFIRSSLEMLSWPIRSHRQHLLGAVVLLHSRLIGRQRTCRPLDEAAEHPCCFVIKILLVVLTRNPVRLSSRPPGCGSETRDRACNTDGPFIRIYWAKFLIHHQDEWKRKMKSNVCRKRNYAYRLIIMPTVIILFLIKPLGFTTFHNC